MPTFRLAYSYDVPCYVDFVVEAKNQREAIKLARKALVNGDFDGVACDPDWSGATNHRVFALGTTPDKTDTPMTELLGFGET